MKKGKESICLLGLLLALAAVFLCAPPAGAVSYTFDFNVEELIHTSGPTNLIAEPFSLSNETGETWTDFHLRLEGENDLGMTFPYMGFEDLGDPGIYTGPGSASFFDVNGDTMGRNEVMEVLGLSVPSGSSFDFTVDILGVPPEGLASWSVFGAPSINGNGQAPIPEPVTILLLGSGLVGLAGFRRKFKK